jgi:HK97 family phage major capsid protein
MPENEDNQINALKTISLDDETLRVGNYIVMFGGRDVQGEYFEADTDLESSYTKSGVLHVDWEHGFEPSEIDPDDVLGYVDWGTLKKDARGAFVERVMNRRNEYVQWLEALITEGMIGTSSEALGKGVVKDTKTGKIKKWPLKRDTLTVWPAEPRMLSQNAITAIKSLAALNPNLKAIAEVNQKLQALEQELGESLDSATAEVTPDVDCKIQTLESSTDEQQEVTKAMEGEEAKAVVPEFDYEKLATILETKRQEAESIKTAPAMLKIPKYSDNSETDAFIYHLKTGRDAGIYKAALTSSTASEGGYLVPDDFYNRIIAQRDELSIARKAGALVIQTSLDVVNVPRETGRSAFTITTAGGAYSESEPTFGQVAITVYKPTNLIKVAEELMDDQAANLEGFLADQLGRGMATWENTKFLVGTGSSEPEGVYVGGTAGLTTDYATTLGASEIPELYFKLNPEYVDGACWVMKNPTLGLIMGLTGEPFRFMPTPQGGLQPQLIGHPVYLSENNAAHTSGLKSIVWGNWNFYGIAERRGLRIVRNPYLYMGNGQIGLFSSFRAGGAVLQAEAFQYATAA